MSSEVIICDSFLSQELISRIEYQINSLEIKDYDNVKNFLPGLKDDILKEKNVIKYAEKVTGINFSCIKIVMFLMN